MVALVTLSASSKGTLTHLLNNLNLGIAATDFGTHFVNLLDTGVADPLTAAESAKIGHLLNYLNLGTARLGFGDLMQAFFSTKSAREAAARAMTPRLRAELVQVLNNLNLGLYQAGFGEIVDQAIDAVLAAAPATALAFTTNLTDQTVAHGADATWTVAVTGGTAPYTYAWFWNGAVIDPATNATAATAALTNHAITAGSAGAYHCEVTDTDGSTIVSATSHLTVS